jgi:hypothetical protein
MALATSLAAAISWPPRRGRVALAILGVLVLAAPAVAVEQVYIWRDPSGTVRFSPVREPEERHAVESTAGRDDGAPPPITSDVDRAETY